MLKLFVPDLYVNSIHEIDLRELQAAGIRGIITDLDNTLVAWSEPSATREVIQWLDNVRDRFGMQVTIVSNNNETRVAEFARPLCVKYIAKANKPRGAALNLAMQWMGTKPEETVMVGDQLFTDILGGNRRGLRTILVMPIHPKEFLGTKVLRLMEQIVLSLLRKKGMIEW